VISSPPAMILFIVDQFDKCYLHHDRKFVPPLAILFVIGVLAGFVEDFYMDHSSSLGALVIFLVGLVEDI
jgi:hypothetical protein